METAVALEQDVHPSIEELVKNASALVSPPEICFKIFELIDSRHGTAEALGEVISQDPSLTMRLLKIVNSAFYNFPSRIDTVSRAVAIIGSAELYNLVVAVKAVRSFSSIPANVVNMDSFWQHSLYAGIISRDLAKRCKVLHPERLFIGGLLHDVGSLIMFSSLPTLSSNLLNLVEGNEAALAAAETETLGYSHAELGAELMKLWNLPQNLQDVATYHHRPADAPHAQMEVAILHLADALANQTGMGTFAEESPEEFAVHDAVWEHLNLDRESLNVDEILGEAGLKFAEMSSLLLSKEQAR